MNRFAIEDVKYAIESMLLQYPELADDEQLRADMFEAETDLNSVIGNLITMTLDAETMAEALKLRKAEIDARKSRFERKSDGIRNVIAKLMEQANLPKIVLVEATVSTRNIAPTPVVTDVALLPDDCVRIERKPDMAAIKAAVEAKREVPGTAISNGKVSLTIRTR
jgi:hypothetical protein